MKSKKIILMPVGIGLAHVGRSIVLGKELLKRGHTVIIACGPESRKIIEDEGLLYREVDDFTREDVLKAQRLNPFFITSRRLRSLVESELSLFSEEKPDLVISEFRITAKISTAVLNIPYVFVTNTDMTKFYDYSRAKLSLPTYWSRFLPEKTVRVFETRIGQRVTKKAYSALTRLGPLPILLHFNRVRRFYKLPPLLSIFDITMGDITLLVDIPNYRPVKQLPYSVFQVGPLFWGGGKILPEWAHTFSSDKKPVLYVTASGTGDPSVFSTILEYLRGGPWKVIATVGNTLRLDQVKGFFPPQFYITDFLPGEWIFPKCSLLIFPGGNSSAYQVLSFGKPQIVVPINIDQEDNANQLVRLGVAIKLDPHHLTQERLLSSITIMLHKKSFTNKSIQLAETLHTYDGPKKAADIVNAFLKMNDLSKS